MGWTIHYCKRSEFAPRKFFVDLLGKESVVDGTVKSGAFYAAVRYPQAPGVVRAVVCVTDWSGGHNRLAYKIIDECEGPYYYDCPKRIIDMLSPLSDEFDGEIGAANAAAWRSKCLANRNYEQTARNELSDPLKYPLTLKSPIKLTNGFTVNEIGAALNRRRSAWVWRSTNGIIFAATPGRIYDAAHRDVSHVSVPQDAEHN